MAEKERRVELLVIMTLVCILKVLNGSDQEIPAVVNRRDGGDTYYLYALEDLSICHDDNKLTYLAMEKQCVRNEELLNNRGCRFAVVPEEESSYLTLTLVITEFDQQHLLMTAATTSNFSHQVVNATIVYSETPQPILVVSSICHIASLEVYRGRDHVIRIRHNGFSLSDSGTVEIDNISLAYDFEEYLGELYRMNLSCSGGGLPESGCLFFKVFGTSNITIPKFNNSVPGTIIGISDPITMESDSDTSFSSTVSYPSPTATEMLSTSPSSRSGGPDLFVYVIVAVTGIVALLFVVVLLSTILAYCYSLDKKRNRHSITVATNLWFEQRDLVAINSPGPPYGANTLDTIQ